MRHLSCFLLCLIPVVACTSSSPGASLETTAPDVVASTPTVPTQESASGLDPDRVPSDAEIRIERKGGAGATLYQLQLSAGGAVEYEGVHLVAERGTQQGRISAEEFADLWRTLIELDRDHRDVLDACVPTTHDDRSAFAITLRTGDDVLHFFGQLEGACSDNDAYRVLRQQYREVVAVSKAQQWIGDEIE